jgi:hypothetical protein
MGTFVRILSASVVMAGILTATLTSPSWASATPPAPATAAAAAAAAAEQPSQGSLVVVCAGTRMDYGCEIVG